MDTLTSGHGMCFSRTSSCCIPTGGGVVWGKHCVKATLETKITFIAWKCWISSESAWHWCKPCSPWMVSLLQMALPPAVQMAKILKVFFYVTALWEGFHMCFFLLFFSLNNKVARSIFLNLPEKFCEYKWDFCISKNHWTLACKKQFTNIVCKMRFDRIVKGSVNAVR